MTSSTEINQCLSILENYVGTFSKDGLPLIDISENTTKYLVVNTDPAHKRGEHWLGLVLRKNKCLYFDSFGLKIVDKEILNYLYNLGYTRYTYSGKCIQPFYSNKCAYYVICFILSDYSGKTYKNFILNFKSLRSNDTTVINMLKKY